MSSKKRPDLVRERTDTIVEDDERVRTERPPAMKGAAIAKVTTTKVVEQRASKGAAQEEKVSRGARTRHPGREDTYTAPPKTASKDGSAEEARLAAMRELYAKGDTEGALSVASGLKPKTAPMAFAPIRPPSGDYEIDAQTIAKKRGSDYEREAQTLVTKRSAPKLLMSRAQISKTPLDPRARTLVDRIDGVTPMKKIVEQSGLGDDVAQKLIERLLSLGVITFA
jgi:hypothetical protein